MTPRHSIVSLPVDAELDHVLSVMAEHKFTRLPVYEDRPEQIIGIVHFKDLTRVWDERGFAHDRRRATRPFRLRRFLRKPLVVPETKPLNQLIDEFRTNHTHMALVVDEFGTVAGLVTLEDVLEQVFGEIGDEHDVVRPTPSYEDKVLQLEGTTTIRDLENRYNIVLPSEAGFETLAGFLLFQVGHIPKPKTQSITADAASPSRIWSVIALPPCSLKSSTPKRSRILSTRDDLAARALPVNY